MIQFTRQEMEMLRDRSRRQPEALRRLKEEVKEVFGEALQVPKEGIANWTLYYYCPHCSVMLEFDRKSPHHHSCPSCGRVLTGEPFDSAWWGMVNASNHSAAFKMGLIHMITGETAYGRKAIDLMVEYANYYRDYQVHGEIPYNGPGKSGAQTLDEANFLRSFAMAYDLLDDEMTKEEQKAVREGMFLPGVEFLMEHRHNQLHNHEVIINSAIAIIGLIFQMDACVRFGVYEPYGILWQLERGMLPDHMWFEGAFGYHFYALTSFFAYEKFALHTPHSHIRHPNYKAMMELLVSYLEPEFRIPMLNDTNYGHTTESLRLYEFAYREMGGEKLLYILNELYKKEERNHLEAFVYGVETLPPCSLLPTHYHVKPGESGSTVLRGRDGRYLLLKHDRYGGEHDHYDRLSFSYLAFGKRISPDLGTTGYGALMHYDYYKNSGTHNTVTIGEENQSPVNAILTRYEEKDEIIYVDAKADWTDPYEMPDSFTIVQWKEEYYKTVVMERKIAWAPEYFAEVFTVKGVGPDRSIDWVMHVSGQQVSGQQVSGVGMPGAADTFSDKKPYGHLRLVRKYLGTEQTVTAVYGDGEIETKIFSRNGGQQFFYGQGPDNPSVSYINYLIERAVGGNAIFAHVITSGKAVCPVSQVEFLERPGQMVIGVWESGGRRRELVFGI